MAAPTGTLVTRPDKQDVGMSDDVSAVYEGRDLEAMAFARNYHAWIRDEISGLTGGDVAEVGAGDGLFSRMLLEAGPRSLTLFEPSAAMHARQPAELRADPRVRRANARLGDCIDEFDSQFDAVLYINVLEHIPDDAAELALVRRVLRPGGRVAIFVPALSWLMSDFDRSIGHHRRYRRQPLRALLESTGFTIERLHYFDGPGVIPWLVAMRWLRLGLSPRSVALYDGIAVPILRRVEPIVRPPIGKNLLAIARRS
jgi:SAM-dependent methyltransferase